MYPSPDPFTTMIRKMCTKDKIVQSLYQHTISWGDVPSDDDVLELDDWKSYQKIKTRAKEAYQHHVTAQKVYTIPQRSKAKKCDKVASRIPYAALKQRSESKIVEEIIQEIVHQPPVEYQEMELVPNQIVSQPVEYQEIVPNEIVPNEIIEVHPDPIKNISSLYVLYCIIFLSLTILFYRITHK